MSSKTKQSVFKVAIAGDSGVGKSSILTQYTDHQHKDVYDPTIGIDLRVRSVKYQQNTIKMQIWDTSGLEKYRSILYSYFRNLNAFILVFSLTDHQSFKHIYYWLNILKENNSEISNLVFVLVGNKSDLLEDRQVTPQQIEQLICDLRRNWKLNGHYFETSVKNEKSLSPIFEYIAQSHLENQSFFYEIPLRESTTYKQLNKTTKDIDQSHQQDDQNDKKKLVVLKETSDVEDKPQSKRKFWYLCC